MHVTMPVVHNMQVVQSRTMFKGKSVIEGLYSIAYIRTNLYKCTIIEKLLFLLIKLERNQIQSKLIYKVLKTNP